MATKPKRPRDPNQLAKLIAGLATGEIAETDPDAGKDPNKVKAGKAGGLHGGKARKEALTPQRRKQIAKKAASARWGK
jgi:hypothetical protein